MKIVFRSIIITGLLLALGWIYNGFVAAQNTSLGIGVMLPVLDDLVADGSVVCMGEEGLVMCRETYDHRLFGAVADTPAAYFETVGDEGRYIVSSGKSSVRAVGPIASGELVTTSETPGVVVRAEKAGYVLGTALEDLEAGLGESTIAVAVNIRYDAALAKHRTNLVEMLRQSASAPIMEPLESFRYLIAAILVIVAFGMGFFYYGRMATTGVEAIGRNPLAQKSIQIGVLMNLVVTLVIVLAGLVSAWLVLVL